MGEARPSEQKLNYGAFSQQPNETNADEPRKHSNSQSLLPSLGLCHIPMVVLL